MKDCPVCGKAGLIDGASRCPQCGADLECFELLDSLGEQVAAAKPAEREFAETGVLDEIRASLRSIHEAQQHPVPRRPMRGYSVVAFLVVLILVLYRDFAIGRWLDEQFSQLNDQMTAVRTPAGGAEQTGVLTRGIDVLAPPMRAIEDTLSVLVQGQKASRMDCSTVVQHLSEVSERVRALEAQVLAITVPTLTEVGLEEDDFFYHQPLKGETLWTIAERYYGSGRFYPVLLEHNPGLGIYYGPGYGAIRVLRYRHKAKDILDALIVEWGEQTLFRYRVAKGETWVQLSQRFFGHRGGVAELSTLNGERQPVPGQRVLVPLR